jgi:hypothetical protein
MQRDSPRGLYGQRPSKSGDESRRAQFEAIKAMTARERMLLALELGDLCQAFQQLGEDTLAKAKR